LARTILLADDSVTAQNMGRRILVDAGYEVITVNNGSSALKKITEEKPDLIVLDVYMPGYGGLEVCQRIRESPETARIPVLLTVGKLEPFKADEARRVRADAFIVKPFEASELLTALTNLEDKIVPQPSSPYLKTGALAEPAKDFGDKERGWRSRLRIPTVRGKTREAEPAQDSAPPAADEYYEVKLRGSESAQPSEALKGAPQAAPGAQAGAVEPKLSPSAAPETEAQAPAQSAAPRAGDAVADRPQGDRKAVDDEVAAVLAAIPDNAKGAAAEATMAATAAQVQPTGPRWIAESIAVTKDESSLLLEQEMESTTAAATAAADATRSILSHYGVASPPSESSIPQETKLPPQPEKPESSPDPNKTQEGAPIAVSSSEPAGVAAAPSTETSALEAKEVQAYAAQASAGAAPESQGASTQAPAPSQPSPAADSPAAVVETKEDAAAAVEHLLAGSVTPELTSELIAAAQSASKESDTQPATEAGAKPEDGGGGEALSHLVDKVLAELKPKLIEEIAKKMKKDNN
jgi:CheY-like chemotaxis protein